MTVESLRGEDAGCSVEEHRTIRDGMQAGTGDPTAINNSPMVSHRNGDLEPSKTVFRGGKDAKSSCRTMEKEQRCKSMLANRKMTASGSYSEEKDTISMSTTFLPEKVCGYW